MGKKTLRPQVPNDDDDDGRDFGARPQKAVLSFEERLWIRRAASENRRRLFRTAAFGNLMVRQLKAPLKTRGLSTLDLWRHWPYIAQEAAAQTSPLRLQKALGAVTLVVGITGNSLRTVLRMQEAALLERASQVMGRRDLCGVRFVLMTAEDLATGAPFVPPPPAPPAGLFEIPPAEKDFAAALPTKDKAAPSETLREVLASIALLRRRKKNAEEAS